MWSYQTEIEFLKGFLHGEVDRRSYRDLMMILNVLDPGKVCNEPSVWRDAAVHLVKTYAMHIEQGGADVVVFGGRRVGSKDSYLRISLSAQLVRDSDAGEYVVVFKCGTYNHWLRVAEDEVVRAGHDPRFFSCLPVVDVGDYLATCRVQAIKTIRQTVKPQQV